MTSLRSSSLALAVCAAVAGCAMTLPNPPPGSVANDFARMQADADARTEGQDARFPGFPAVGTTYLSHDPFGHGYQVTYYETPTRSWLWYGGNRISLPAKWEVETRETGDDGKPLGAAFRRRLCYTYPSGTIDAVSERSMGERKCDLLTNRLNFTVASIDGDPFSLADGTAPFARQKCDAPDAFDLPPRSAFGVPLTDCKPGTSFPPLKVQE